MSDLTEFAPTASIRRTAKGRPVFQYICLFLLFVAAIAYQVRFTRYAFPSWFHHADAARWPFLVGVASQGLTIGFLSGRAKEAGLRDGDTLLAVNGRPVTGTAVYGEAIAKAHGGDVLRVTVRSADGQGQAHERTAAITLSSSSSSEWHSGARLPAVLLFVLIMPVFCLLLGFWVAAVRPRDPRAWLLLALMLSFAASPNPLAESWRPVVRDLAMVYHVGLSSSFVIWILLLGIYFPEPFPSGQRWRWWDGLKWLLGVPLALSAVSDAVVAVGKMESYATVAFLERSLAPLGGFFGVCAYAAVSTFFACVWAKSRLAVTRDARRRLRLLYAGTGVSLAPVLVLSLVALFHHRQVEEYFPPWTFLAAYVIAFLFPVTLAYIIVVGRAMDVRVVIRQGLQYALAKGGVRVLRLSITAVLGYVVYSLVRQVRESTLFPYIIIGVGVALLIGLRRLCERLRLWVDRRFFREAYNAEQILSDLSERVRSIVETQPLLVTVSERISDSLHVSRVAVLIDGSGPYRPAHAVGYGSIPDVTFPEDAATVKRLRQEKEPARVYLDSPDSWIYQMPEVSEQERAQLAALRTELLLPLSVKDNLLGFISLGQKLSEEPYSGTDLRLLKSVAVQTGLALENARLADAVAQEVAEREKLNRELEIAREVQERLFPQQLPQVPGLDYSGKCRPALSVGGDYYDFLALPGGKLGIALGDVSGKGIAAALMMASLEASLRAEAMRGSSDLAALIQNVNRLVYDATAENRYATFFYAQYDPQTRHLSYVNAGHNPPMLLRKRQGGREVSRLDIGGMVIGLLPQFPYRQATVVLEPGDLLIAFTDGVSEAMNPADEEWGEDRLMDAVKAFEGQSAAETIARIMKAADQFAAGARQHDDMTLVVLRVERATRHFDASRQHGVPPGL